MEIEIAWKLDHFRFSPPTKSLPTNRKMDYKERHKMKLEKLKQESNTADLIFGSLSGLSGKLVEYPFDTIKVHMQTQQKSMLPVVKSVYNKQGLRGFFNGITAPLLGSMAENAILFVAYNQVQKSLIQNNYFNTNNKSKKDGNMVQKTIAGGVAGFIVSFAITPVEFLKCRMQTQQYLGVSKIVHNSPWSVLKHTLNKQGIRGIYSGHVGTMLRETGGGIAWFTIYELAVQRLLRFYKLQSKSELSGWHLMACGALSGMGYNAALYPADVIKSRQQSGMHGRKSFIKVGQLILKSNGYKGYFRGFGLTVLRSAPSSGVIFLTYEWLSRTFGKA